MSAVGEIDRLRALLAAVRSMREHQKRWFGGDKSAARLEASRKAERDEKQGRLL